jgi:hypothetical protein
MRDLIVIMSAFSLVIIACLLVNSITSSKNLKHREEYKIGIIGSIIFMFISWLIVYIANINPFVEPEFKKAPKPEFMN